MLQLSTLRHLTGPLLPGASAEQESREHLDVRLLNRHAVIINGCVADDDLQRVEIRLQRLPVLLGDQARVGHHGGSALHIHKTHRAVKIEIQLSIVEQVKHRNVVLAKPQVLEALLQLGRRDKQVRNDNDQPALSDLLRRFVQRCREARLAFSLNRSKFVQNHAQMTRVAFRGNLGVKRFSRTIEPDGVTLS